jgi:hypothetical protein
MAHQDAPCGFAGKATGAPERAVYRLEIWPAAGGV